MTDATDDLVAQVLSLADVFSGRAYNADPWAISTEPTAELLRTVAKRIEALESRQRVLLEALEPFARAARSIDVDPPGDHEPSHGRGSVTAGDLRRARAALAGDAG